MTRSLPVAFAFVVLAVSGVASAQGNEMERARDAFIKGARAAEGGRWPEAEQNFREAYEISGRESPLFNWALSLKELERNREAAEQLDNLLRNHQPDPEMRKRARDTLDYLKNQLVVLSLVNLQPDTAYVIHVGDREIFDGGERPFEIFADPGTIRVTVRVEGEDEPFVWEREVPRGNKQTIDVESLPTTLDLDDGIVQDPDDEDEGGLFSSPVFWIVAGVVVAAGAGIGIYALADANADLKPESGNVLRIP